MFSKIIQTASLLTTLALIYNRMNEVSKAKDTLYSQLPPELQDQWKKVLGDPTVTSISSPIPGALKAPPAKSVAATTVTNAEAVKVGV